MRPEETLSLVSKVVIVLQVGESITFHSAAENLPKGQGHQPDQVHVSEPPEGSILRGKNLAQKQDSALKHLFEVLVSLHRGLGLHIVVL